MKKTNIFNEQLHAIADLMQSLDCLCTDFNLLDQWIKTASHPTFFSLGIEIQLRIYILRKCFPRQGALLIVLYLDLYEQWASIQNVLFAKS